MCTARGGCSQSVAEDGPSLCDSCCWEQPTPGRSGCGSGGLMGVILQVALPSRVLAAARLQCGAAGAGASRGLGVCAEHARLAARGESPRHGNQHFFFSLGWASGGTCSMRFEMLALSEHHPASGSRPQHPAHPDRTAGAPEAPSSSSACSRWMAYGC